MSVDNIDVTQTIAKIKRTLSEDKTISAEFRSLVELLLLIVTLLTNKLGLNSRNSSKPPASDPNRKRGSRKKVEGEVRKPGGQRGHIGKSLNKVEKPDIIETLNIDKKTIPRGKYKHIGYESRQVIEIEISRKVTEYQAEIVENSKGKQYTAKFPEGVTLPVQYGRDLKAQSVYMSQQQLIPYDRVQDYFADQCGISISTGSIFNFNKQAYGLLEEFESITRQRLIDAILLHVDETGINIKGKLHWLHSASNKSWTLFSPHKKRGTEAMTEMGILEHFKGIAVHDHWKPYLKYDCLHALCNGHILRELERAWEQDGQKWAKRMKVLLLQILGAVEKAGGSLPKKRAGRFLRKYRAILKKGGDECPAPIVKQDTNPKRGRLKRTKARNLLERLRDYETEVLRFMTEKVVPFTNNQAENDIRMTKVHQKISGCFRSMEGAKIFCRIRSYLSTCRKNGVRPTEALRILFSGKLPDFVHNTN